MSHLPPEKRLTCTRLPANFGVDFAGVVSAVGTSVNDYQVGDKVYGITLSTRSAAEYLLLSPSRFKCSIAKVPGELSFEEAASLPVSAHTAIQALVEVNNSMPGGLKGKTVFVTAGLGGIGHIALQLLKPVFGAEKVITTLSTSKIHLLPRLLGEGLVDQIVDYTKEDVLSTVGRGTVDFVFDTIMMSMSYLPLLKPGDGVVVSAMGKSGDSLILDWPHAPWILVKLLNILDGLNKWRARRLGVRYEHANTQFMKENWDRIDEWARERKLKVIIETTDWDNLDEVRRMFDIVASGKGAIGKYVAKL